MLLQVIGLQQFVFKAAVRGNDESIRGNIRQYRFNVKKGLGHLWAASLSGINVSEGGKSD